jgi:hypothetical protein
MTPPIAARVRVRFGVGMLSKPVRDVLNRTFDAPAPNRNGLPTSRMCGRQRAGSMWRPSSICSPVARLAGR